ncbi:MAG TPA: alpha-L-fucosidase [Prolixibacteraceae bacterium]|nr:alpha-L-fucosidase [Prolixibacteraceae bacterium]
MKIKLIAIVLIVLTVHNLKAQNTYEARQHRTVWFREARFGMFIHWGIYAIPARGEWVRNQEKLTVEDYQKYFDTFDPVDYNPREWAKIAKQAGMKYVVLTAKHHDGFCLFDSKYTDYKATNTPAKRDLIREYVDAFRAEGLKVGFYYSLIDWHHPDYPNVGNHPMAGNPEWDKKKYNWDNYIKYMHNQVEELVTNYGKIDILWFDYSFDDYKGEKWKATELVKMVRKHQPDIIIDNRLGGNMEIENSEVYAGDFEGPEQIIPSETVLDDSGRPIPWESCITLNSSWGYKKDNNYKSATDIIRTLVNCVSKNGNLLLNIGPDAKGNIPVKSIEILHEVGEWMKYNSESIYGCGPSQFSKPEWGWFTQKGNNVYAHILEPNIGQFYLKHMMGKVKSATLLFDGSEMILSKFWNGDNKPFVAKDDLFMNFGMPIQLTYPLPDPRNTVVKIELIK